MRFYWGGYDPGTAAIQIRANLGVLALDPTVIGDLGETRIAGIRSDQMTYTALFDNSTGGFDVAAASLMGSGEQVASIYIGTSTGDIAYCGIAHLFDAPVPIAVKDLVRQEATYQPNTLFQRAAVLANKRAASGSGNTGSSDNSTLTGNGGTMYVHVFNYVAAGTITLQDSADGTTFAAVTNMSYAVSGTGATAIGTSGTLRRYRRFIETTGSFTYAGAVSPKHPAA